MPILISLETSESPLVADRALALHSYLHVKHASLVNIRYLDFARASYEYQRSMTSEVIGHRHGEALLHGWYDLISEKRAWRIDLLKSFTRAFDYDVSKRNTVSYFLRGMRVVIDLQVDTGLILYLSDNLATFEYKLQDEPMSVVYWLGTVIASCIHLASMLESGTLAGEPTDMITGKKLVIPNVRHLSRTAE
jgi:cohesin loading factor subunit SCC2